MKAFAAICIFGVSGLLCLSSSFAESNLPSDKDKKTGLGVPVKDFEKRNERAEEALIKHNKHITLPSPDPAPNPGSSNPPNPTPSASAPTTVPPGLPQPQPVFSPNLPNPVASVSPQPKTTPLVANPLDIQPIANSENLELINSESSKLLGSDSSLKSDIQKAPQEEPFLVRDSALTTEVLDQNALKADNLTTPLSENIQKSESASKKQSIEVESKTKVEEKVDIEALKVKAKRLDPSQMAGLKDRRVEGGVIYNNYTSDISSLMAGEIGIVSDNIYYYARFSNEESKKIEKGMRIRAYLTEPRALEGDILWKGSLESIVSSGA